MTALDPAVRELLVALVDLDERTRHPGHIERSMAMAFAGGVLRGVLHKGVEPNNAAVVLGAWTPTSDPPLVTRPHDWPEPRGGGR